MSLPHIAIISSSIRVGRNSHRISLYFENYLKENNFATLEGWDLMDNNFPLFEERMMYHQSPSAKTIAFAKKIDDADAVIIVTPEYNGGYPASLKNVIDLLYKEWQKKPVAISTVSDGNFGGSQVITSLQFILWKIKAWTVNAMFPVPNVSETFDETGTPTDKSPTDKRAALFIKEILWCI